MIMPLIFSCSNGSGGGAKASEKATNSTDTTDIETESPEDVLYRELTEFLDGFTAQYHMSGYDCSVWYRGEEIYRVRNGYADVENSIKYSENTLIHLYSNTKIIACTAALQLYEKGLFKLDDPISLYFPEMANMSVKTEDGLVPLEDEIRIIDLFTMTSGIGDGSDYTDIATRFYIETGGACPLVELPKYLAQIPLLFRPGEGYCYGISHEVLAALIEKLTGKTFGQYLEENIFEPLGMNNTAFDASKCESNEIANQYSYSGGKLENLGNTNILIPEILRESASGGLISTVDDYVKFLEALRGNTLLKQETVDLMRSNKLTGKELDGYGYTENGLGYGLGVHTVRDVNDPNALGAYGWGGAAGTLALVDPENGITVFYAQQFFGSRDIQGNSELANIIYEALGIKD